MGTVQGSGDRFAPFLLLAAGLHGAMLLTVRLDTQPTARRLPADFVLDAALEPRSVPAEANPAVPVPTAALPGPASAGQPDVNPVRTMPAHAESGEATVLQPHGRAVPRAEQRRQAAVLPAAPAPATRDPDGSETPMRPAATGPERRHSGGRPAEEATVQSGNDVEGAEPAPERARLTSAILDRQISEWTTAYAETRAREAALPPRTAHVEKVTTHRYAADAYERDWQDKVERVGNLNYPEEARRKNLSGGLLLSVGVNADGSLKGITVAKSSGHAELDEAAVRIVRLAAPFAPFPSQLKTDYDVLVITRTWRFFTDHHLVTAP